MIATRVVAALVASLVLALPAASLASNRYDPRLRFRTISTPRFDIHFHQGEESQARRLADIAERVAARLDGTLGPPAGRVHVILVDQTDRPNGWATPVPYNLIEITAAAPSPGTAVGNTDDWLELVFTHEYTHVVHLSRSGGWIGGLRKAFGRMPLLLPNLYLPLWQIEGVATYEESATTRQGRVPAPDFRLLLEGAAAASRFEPIDRANGGLVDWPGGTAPYLYGAYFHEYLASTYGEQSLRRLADETSRRIPYLGSPAFREVFGRSLDDLWAEFGKHVAPGIRADGGSATRLTHHGFTVAAPRFAVDGHLFYSVVNPHGFPALLALALGETRPRRVTTRYLGTGTTFAGSQVVFDQLELVNQVGLQSDLYAAPSTGGASWRITRGARAADPDVSPDGRTIACTVQQADRREIALVRLPDRPGDLAAPIAIVSEPDTYFTQPRWSPDGRWFAAGRTRPGSPGEIVLIDPASKRVVRAIAPSASGRSDTPSWMADGRLLFASTREGGAFQIYAVHPDGDELQRLEGTGPSARSPEVSPDGKTLVFVGYTPEGHDLFSLPLEQARWTRVEPPASTGREGPVPVRSPVPAERPSRTYSPWRSLAPRFWTPTVESDSDELVIGGATASADALGRHLYGAEIGFTGSRGRPDWQVAYVYDRWRPSIFVSVADDTDPWRDGELRTSEADAGLIVPFRRVRQSQSVLAAFHGSTDSLSCAECAPPVDARVDRRAVRAGWAVDAARSFGYSISTEEGWQASVTTELTREALGAEDDSGAATVDVRGYLPMFPRHGVIAARLAAATSWGGDRTRRVFTAAGSGPQAGGFRFGSDAIGLLRGVREGDLAGDHAAVINLDFRFPLLRVDRGAGIWPIFARAVHGAVFVDAGHAWTGRFRAADVRSSIGAELSMDAVIGFVLPITFTTGAAWRETSSGDRGVVAFGRIGRAF